MPIPAQLPTIHKDGQGPNLLYHVEGELVPVLRLQLGGSVPAYFEITSCSGRSPLSTSR